MVMTGSSQSDSLLKSLENQILQISHLYNAAHYAAVLEEGNAAYQVAAQGKYFKEMAQLRLLQGSAAYDRGEYISAYEYAFEGLVLFKKVNDLPGQINILRLLGMICRQTGDLPTGLNYHLRQLSLARYLQDEHSQAHALHGIVDIYYTLKQYDRAITYCEQALAFYMRLEDRYNEAILLNKACEIFMEQGEYPTALELGLQSQYVMQTSGSLAHPADETSLLLSLASVYQVLHQDEEVEDYLNRALDISNRYGLNRQRCETLYRTGLFYKAQGNLQAALDPLLEALQIAEDGGFARTMALICQALSGVYRQLHDFERALYYHEYYHRLWDEIFNENRSRQRKLLEVRFQTENALKEAEYYQLQSVYLQQQRDQDRRYFEKLSNLKDDLLAITSHDLKNPISSILTSIYLLRKKFPAAAGSYVDNIEQQAYHISQLITSVLDLAKLETGQALNINVHPVAPLLQKSMERHQTLADQKNITLTFEAADLTLTARCDPVRLAQVMDNLLSNAIKYTPEQGRVLIQLMAGDLEIQISIQDSGQGIDAQELPHIFDRFYRARNSHQQGIEGTGLGLAIAKSIVEQHGGRIQVESSVGSGTTFTFTLPAG